MVPELVPAVQLAVAPVAVTWPVAEPPVFVKADDRAPVALTLPVHWNAPPATVLPLQLLNEPVALFMTNLRLPVSVPAILQV